MRLATTSILILSTCFTSIGGCASNVEVSQNGPHNNDRTKPTENTNNLTSPLEPADASLEAPDSEYVQVPGGRRIHTSCVHPVPANGTLDIPTSRILDSQNNVVEQYGHCKYKEHGNPHSGSGATLPLPDTALYQEYSGADAATTACGTWGPPYFFTRYCAAWYNSYVGTVRVPAAPTDVGQLIYLWSGLMAKTNVPAGGVGIPLIQSVLQWGNNGRPGGIGGGAYWSFNNWYIDRFGVGFPGPTLTTITAGDELVMNPHVNPSSSGCTMSGNNCNWSISSWRNSDGVGTSYNVNGIPGTFDSVYRAVLEAYDSTRAKNGAPACNIYPIAQGAGFYRTAAYQPFQSPTDYHQLSQAWTAVTHTINPYCAYGQTVGNQTDTWLYFTPM